MPTITSDQTGVMITENEQRKRQLNEIYERNKGIVKKVLGKQLAPSVMEVPKLTSSQESSTNQLQYPRLSISSPNLLMVLTQSISGSINLANLK
ncbi:hypothetical protein Glove_267g7 [Diversispora epigaea]|uniref:Uncharacterized protein n=1 Tax=Diversispora epigaea TaxID=1348612 RepID=A0A397I965_9GLOM|nr:hypothetical protein Glove_267g7 [Diversispora epigaea]